MCGRFTHRLTGSDLLRLYRLATPAGVEMRPRYNVAPSQPIPIVRRRSGDDRELVMARWGLIPAWSKGPDSRFSMINARAETVLEKPAYRDAFRRRRCLIPADGFYEWQKVAGGKQPWYFVMADERPFSFAALWELWNGPRGEILSCAIIVGPANDLVKPVHDRMPVIVDEADYGAWLDVDAFPAEAALTILRPYPAGRMKTYKVGKRVNRPENDDPDCLAPLQTGELL